MRMLRQRKGQFIIIAVLVIAIMIVASGAVMYGMVTYFKQKQWEEYLAVVDNIEINSQRVLEVGLASSTMTLNQSVLRTNIDQWKNDVRKVYPGYGIGLESSLPQGSYNVYGYNNVTYNLGIARRWYRASSFSAANATFSLNLTSVGLIGYKFFSTAFLEMNILDSYWDSSSGDLVLYLTVEKEDSLAVTDLQMNSFSLSVDMQPSKNFTLMSYYYNQTYDSYVYRLFSHAASATEPTYVLVSVVDARNIKVAADYTSGNRVKMYNPTDDSWVESKNPDSNMGMQDTVHVRRDKGTPGNIRRTYMKYNLSEIPFGEEVTSARYWVYCKAATPATDTEQDLYATASDNWSESMITWNNAPPPSIFVSSTLIDGTGKWYSWDITWFFKQEYSGDKIMTLIIRLPPAMENSTTMSYHKDFYSSQSDKNRPYIDVYYAQAPSASFTYSPSNPLVDQTVSFDASASYDPEGFIMEYQWDFGDSTPLLVENDPLTTHVYAAQGNYTVTLNVLDIKGLEKSISKIVKVG